MYVHASKFNLLYNIHTKNVPYLWSILEITKCFKVQKGQRFDLIHRRCKIVISTLMLSVLSHFYQTFKKLYIYAKCEIYNNCFNIKKATRLEIIWKICRFGDDFESPAFSIIFHLSTIFNHLCVSQESKIA